MIPSVDAVQNYTAVSALSLKGGYVPVVGPASDGPYTPTPLTSTDAAIALFSGGKGLKFACKLIKSKKLPVLFCRADASMVSAFGDVTRSNGHGTSVVTVRAGSTTSVNAAVRVLVTTGGTIGTSFSYRVSTNGGRTYGTVTNVTTATNIAITLGTGTLTLDFATGNLATNEVIAVPANSLLAGTYATIDSSEYPLGTNTAVASNTASTYPDDDYEIATWITQGGTLGTAGIKFRYSLKTGADINSIGDWSNEYALGTDLSITIPGTGGAGPTLGTEGQTVGTDAVIRQRTYGPNFNTQSVSDALTKLFNSTLPWRRAVLAGAVDQSLAQTIDTMFITQYKTGLNNEKAWIGNARLPQLNETDQSYFTAMQSAFPSRQFYHGSICYGDCKQTSAILAGGPEQKVEVCLPVAADLATVGPEIDIARTDRPGLDCRLADDRGNPDCHDERVLPGPDDLGFITLLTQPEGVYVTNPRIFGPAGSGGGVDPMTPHRDIVNIHTNVARGVLRKLLSVDIFADKDGHISESDASRIEDIVNHVEEETLKGMISAQRVSLSRSDVLTNSNPPTITVTGEVQSKIYPKKFNYSEQMVVKLSST